MSFWKKIYLKSIVPDMAAMVIIFTYVAIALQLDLMSTVKIAIFILAFGVGSQIFVSPLVDWFLFKSISKDLSNFENGEFDEQERTIVLERIMQMPIVCMIKTSVFYVTGSFIFAGTFYFVIGVAVHLSVLCLLYCFFGSYFISLVTYHYSSAMCTEYAYKIIDAGVDKTYVMQKRRFGLSLFSKIVLYLFVPVIGQSILICAVMVAGYMPFSRPELWISPNVQKVRMLFTIFMGLFLVIYTTLLFLKTLAKGNANTTEVFEKMQGKNLMSDTKLATDLQDELSYGYYLINEMIKMFRHIMARSSEISEQIVVSAQDLVTTSHETETTAIEQSTGVSEIVSTMDNTNRMAHEIEGHITEVADLANVTAQNVSFGINILQQNLQKISEIADLNKKTGLEIHDLTSKAVSIWEIVNLINSIADQTKIIAFNAELEATNVRQGGKNFRNVANEIRRLANNTMDSTEEIKKRINEMQTSMSELNNLSSKNTEQIEQGYNFIHSLEENFMNVNSSAEANAGVSNEIKELVSKQAASFEQVAVTIQQISESLQTFSDTTRSIIDTADGLRENANTMEKVGGIKKDGMKDE